MEFRRERRNAELFLSAEWRQWRLASVDEVRKNMETIKNGEILESWDIARLLDGWVDGPGYRCNVTNGFKPNMGHMLLVKTQVSRPYEMFSGVELKREGMEAALLLSCEDKILEVMCFVLNSIIKNFNEPNLRQAELDFLMESLKRSFNHRMSILLYAADQPTDENNATLIADLIVSNFEYGKELVKAADKHGRTALQLAALHGHIHLCTFLMINCGLKADVKDRNGENLLHFAVNSNKVAIVQSLLQMEDVKRLIASQDSKGKTPLHKAAANGNKDIIAILLAESVEADYVGLADSFGQTALLEAARGAHFEAVKYLLEKGSMPLLERNSEGKTALHYCVQIANQRTALAVSKILLEHCKNVEERLLLLWASAKGMGTAGQSAEPHIQVFLKGQRELAEKSSSNLLLSAVKLGYNALAWELINRGADTHDIDNPPNTLSDVERERVTKFLKRAENMPEGGRDQPTIFDSLGRKAFAEGLAALFLNPYVKSPVTVGISGGWGMGKSSLMLQTEMILLQASAQLAFPNILPIEDFPGSKQYELTGKGQQKYRKVKNGVKDLLPSLDRQDNVGDPLVHFLDNYQEKYRLVYQSLALMDREEMFRLKGKQPDSSNLGKIPSILSVRYNAWHYQNELEAWAGLAVTITGAMEETMTRAQRIRSRCKYAWKEHGRKIIFEFILPCLLALLISCWATWVVWILLDRTENRQLEDLKYGSIPVTLVVFFWTMMRQMHSVFQPVSVQIMGYVSAAGHGKNLGYQHQVISDINFLKNQICEKPNWFWKFLACNWFWRMCGCYADTVKGTSVPKLSSHSKDIRMIVFVDDLDRCHDHVILQVLSASNLVLAVCEINVILGMDKKMIARAIAHKYQDNDSLNGADLAEKYLSKIVQLPLALPDSSSEERKMFLDQQLGEESNRSVADVGDSSQILQGAQPTDSSHSLQESIPAHASDVTDVETGKTDQNPEQSRSIIYKFKNFCRIFKALGDNFCRIFKPLSDRLSRCCQDTAIRKIFSMSFISSASDKDGPKLQSTPINSQLILPTYSDEERKVIHFLSEQASHPQIPRDWKRFLTYHRLAWNILSQLKQVKNLAGWEVQLIVWIFCCWQWKENINLIIKKWKELLVFLKSGTLRDEDPSLKIIVENYLDNFKDVPVETDKKDRINLIIKNFKTLMVSQSGTRQDEDQPLQILVEHYLDNMKEVAAGNDSWELLMKTLNKYDVPMESILCFQKFRLHCDIGYLALPTKANSSFTAE